MFFFMSEWITAALEELRRSWGWILTLGISLIVLGAACIAADQVATFVTVVFFGWVLLLSAIAGFINMFAVGTWPGAMLYLLSALIRGFTGYLLVRYPSAGAVSLTLVLATLFVVGGLFRAIGASAIQFPRWGWSAVSGILSFVLGIMLLVQLPQTSVWFIGLAIGIDALVDGIALTSFALAVRHLPSPPRQKFA
jgi:uncharacterized membrane protein HdeD (DUF308 family)